MFRTILVLMFLAACGFYFHQGEAPQASVETPHKLDSSPLETLRKALPAPLFEKNVQPALERNKSEGLTSADVKELIGKLEALGQSLSGRASEAATEAARQLENAVPAQKSVTERGVEKAESLVHSLGASVQESMPAVKEGAGQLLQGIITIFSRLLTTAADLLQNL